MAIATQTQPVAPKGMNQADAVHEVSPEFARWLIDTRTDQPGWLIPRGIVDGTNVVGVNNRVHGLAVGWNPSGALRYGVLYTGAAPSTVQTKLIFRDSAYASLGSGVQLDTNPVSVSNAAIFSSNPMLNTPGGVLIGYGGLYDGTDNKRGLAIWRGAGLADYSTGTITSTRGATAVTGVGTSWATLAEPGMFLLSDLGAGNYGLIGVVKAVTDNTHIVLEQGALFAVAGGNYKLTSVRGLSGRAGAGRITVASGTTTVNGVGTKFNQQGVTSAMALFRASDMAYIGDVSSVASDTQLTLSANSGISLSNERYVGIKKSATFAVSSPEAGFLSAAWNGRQWYANGRTSSGSIVDTDTVWYSETFDPEALDYTVDGNSIKFPSATGTPSPLMGMIGTQPALLFLKETETYGIFSTGTPGEVSAPRKVLDDGVLSTMAVQPYKAGALWAGKRGIYFFDGTNTVNLVEESLGTWYAQLVSQYVVSTTHAWSMIHRDHLFLYLENAQGIAYYKNGVPTSPSRITLVLNLKTNAVALWTNVNIRGAAYAPAYGNAAAGTRWIMDVNDGAGQHQGYISNADDLFDVTGAVFNQSDVLTGYGDTAGPDFYIQTASYALDDPQRKKRFKEIMLHYLAKNTALNIDTVTNFDITGDLIGTNFPASASYVDKPLKFNRYAQMLAFRIYPATAGSHIEIGPWALGFKLLRPGRV